MKNSSKQSVKMDMLHGSLFDKMLMFAMPLAACSILQQLFNSVGTAVVGRFASSEALAAVGSNSSVIALMVTLFSGISLGSNVVPIISDRMIRSGFLVWYIPLCLLHCLVVCFC